MASFEILPVRSREDLLAVAGLFRAYARALPIDLDYQGFEAELASLPGKYAAPLGEILLAKNESGEGIGCVAVRPMGAEGCCEMKRLYVAPDGRGIGLGRGLARAIIEVAERAGYREMRLDTLSTMDAALALYRSEGFVEIPGYYDTPIANTVFMARRLRS